MQVFDASSIIHAWDTYMPEQFPGLWEWLALQITAGKILMPKPTFDEVKDNAPDCWEWLANAQLKPIPIGNDIANEALRIKDLLKFRT